MPVVADAASKQIEVMFSGLHKRRAVDAIPAPGTLSSTLNRLADRTGGSTCPIDHAILELYATAAVEMWHRSVHSFLISASLTKASPLWSSVSGYYSSHYSVRAFAHLLGYFHLRNKRRIIQVEVQGKHLLCHIIRKHAGDREHKFYWKTVKNHARFATNPFFTGNEEGSPRSDIGHRSKANYVDHVNQFPTFKVLDEEYLKERVEKIAGIEVSDAPIPRTEAYPDTENVQLIAYHRMIQLRKFIDEALGDSNRFWRFHRTPGWCASFLDYQIVEPKYMAVYKEQLS